MWQAARWRRREGVGTGQVEEAGQVGGIGSLQAAWMLVDRSSEQSPGEPAVPIGSDLHPRPGWGSPSIPRMQPWEGVPDPPLQTSKGAVKPRGQVLTLCRDPPPSPPRSAACPVFCAQVCGFSSPTSVLLPLLAGMAWLRCAPQGLHSLGAPAWDRTYGVKERGRVSR